MEVKVGDIDLEGGLEDVEAVKEEVEELKALVTKLTEPGNEGRLEPEVQEVVPEVRRVHSNIAPGRFSRS